MNRVALDLSRAARPPFLGMFRSSKDQIGAWGVMILPFAAQECHCLDAVGATNIAFLILAASKLTGKFDVCRIVFHEQNCR